MCSTNVIVTWSPCSNKCVVCSKKIFSFAQWHSSSSNMPPNETTLNFEKIEEDRPKSFSTLVLFVNGKCSPVACFQLYAHWSCTLVLIKYLGKKIEIDNPDPSMTLLPYLRRELGLTGTKLGCGEGGCGACTVMLSLIANHEIKHISANACLIPLCSLHGVAVTTVEGIGSTKTRLHQVQKQIADNHGSQCGFCTPGIVMSMFTLLRNNPYPKMTDIETYFQVITFLYKMSHYFMFCFWKRVTYADVLDTDQLCKDTVYFLLKTVVEKLAKNVAWILQNYPAPCMIKL